MKIWLASALCCARAMRREEEEAREKRQAYSQVS